MIIEFLAQHPVLIAGIVSVFIFWYTFRMFRRTIKEEEDTDGLIITGKDVQGITEWYAKADQLPSNRWFLASGSATQFTDEYTGVSGTSVYFDEFDPYNHPVMKEHEVVRCKYCKRQNKATNEVCLGCGATL